ncbi:ABC transporter ATPase [Sphingobacteriaceae bacterium]|nr:ABC transporter ATPase [Sphingobacteriaceae bacterium]
MNRVWTYIISKPLSQEQLENLVSEGKKFVTSWTAHENKLSADFKIFKNRIIVVTVDEDVANASGCSIDKLTRFIKETEANLGIELLNRFYIAYKNGENLEVVHSGKVKELLEEGLITENTVVYNTAVANENEFLKWEQALRDTWLSKYLTKV